MGFNKKSFPSIRILPPLGSTSPVSIPMVVVLPATVRPEESEELSSENPEGDSPHHLVVPEFLAQVLDRNHGLRHRVHITHPLSL